MEGEPILKKTLYTVAVMVAAWVTFIGTVSIVAVLVTTRAVAAPESGPATHETEPGASPSPKGFPAAPSRPRLPSSTQAQPI